MTLTSGETSPVEPVHEAEATAAPPAELDVTGRKSLGDRMALQRQARALLVDPSFDPERDIGRLARIEGAVEQNVDLIMSKIDNTVGWIQACDDYATNCARMAAWLSAQAKAATANANKSRAYVEFQMGIEGPNVKELVGHEFVLRKKRTSGNPSVQTTRDATAEDLVELSGDYVRVIPPTPVSYAWDKKAICKVLKDIEATDMVPGPITNFCSLKYDEEIVHEPVGKPVSKRKGKKK